MKAYHFLDKVTERVSREFNDPDTRSDQESLDEYMERREIDRKMREVKEQLKGGENT